MDKLKNYGKIAREVIAGHASGRTHRTSEEMDDQLILDDERGHYLLLAVGWDGFRRVYYPVFHIDIKNGKVWVQEDATDSDLVGELENRGIPKEDIVLAFHAPYKRPFTEYAVA